MKPCCWYDRVNHDFPKVADEQIDRVKQEQALNRIAVVINHIEDSGHVHQQLRKYGPKVLDIPKEHVQCRQNKPNTDIEQQQAGNRIQQQQKLPSKSNPVQDTEKEKNTQRKPEID